MNIRTYFSCLLGAAGTSFMIGAAMHQSWGILSFASMAAWFGFAFVLATVNR